MPTPNYDIFTTLAACFGGQVEHVTVQKRSDPTADTFTDYEDIEAFPMAFQDVVIDPEGMQTVVSRVTWHIRARDLTDAGFTGVLDRADRIVSTSTVWSGTYVLFSANLVAVGTRWVCESSQKLVNP